MKLCVPSGIISTTMFQPSSSIESKTIRRLNSVLHGIPRRSRFTVRNGGDCGVIPSITRSSSWN